MKKTATKIVIATTLMSLTNLTYAQEFKRFSVSAGWLHVMPQGKGIPLILIPMLKMERSPKSEVFRRLAS